MRVLGHIWTAIKGIIALSIAVAIFGVANTSFETVVLAILVLIYLSIGSFMAVYGLTQSEILQALANDLEAIKKLIKKDTKGETDDDKEERAEAESKKSKVTTDFYINTGFSIIIYIITLFKLISAF